MAGEPEQSYASHARLVPLYHVWGFGLLVLTLIGAGVNLYESVRYDDGLYSASLIFVLTLIVILVAYFARAFALRAQDRVIRVEEQLRHYLLTSTPLDARLTVRQIIGLRFASDEEFPALAARAARESLAPDDIKKAVTRWRADNYRV
jgi:hypothetical protein